MAAPRFKTGRTLSDAIGLVLTSAGSLELRVQPQRAIVSDMKDVIELLHQSWTTLLLLASGYAAYCVANLGIREHHKAADTVFSTLVFAFISAFAFYFCQWMLVTPLVVSSGITFVFALIAGAAWRVFGRPQFEQFLRATRISHSDDLPSAWLALFGERRVATQLSVQLKDGTWLMCADLREFRNSPNGPCVLGAKGDILMYVTDKLTDEQSKRGSGFVSQPHPIDSDPLWGHEITYIPPDQVAKVTIRYRA